MRSLYLSHCLATKAGESRERLSTKFRPLAPLDSCPCMFKDLLYQDSHRLEKYLNIDVFLEKSLKIKSALKRTGKSLEGLEKSLNSTIFCMS